MRQMIRIRKVNTNASPLMQMVPTASIARFRFEKSPKKRGAAAVVMVATAEMVEAATEAAEAVVEIMVEITMVGMIMMLVLLLVLMLLM